MLLRHRYQRFLLAGLMLGLTLYLLLPLTASYLLAQGLRHYGYQHVKERVGRLTPYYRLATRGKASNC